MLLFPTVGKLKLLLRVFDSSVTVYSVNVQVLTCDKLSHCLFDFDCVDLNIYERESYNYDFHLIKELKSTSEDTPDLTSHDCKHIDSS